MEEKIIFNKKKIFILSFGFFRISKEGRRIHRTLLLFFSGSQYYCSSPFGDIYRPVRLSFPYGLRFFLLYTFFYNHALC